MQSWMGMTGTQEMMSRLIEIAREAGEAIMEIYNGQIRVEKKDDDSPLTMADLAAHHMIKEALEELWPDIPVLSEEGGIPEHAVRSKWERFWLVDPLDGTKEFIKRNGEFTVNIALIEQNRPAMGVVHVPARKTTYYGQSGNGSFRIRRNRDPERIYSNIPEAGQALNVVTSRSHGSEDLKGMLTEKGITVGEMIPAGSSLKFCLVAEGTADLYPRLGPTMEWDTAAGDAVFRYSGRDGERKSPLEYNKESLLNDGFMIGL
ncbi:MAG: 3'(2'),5'-bisphosphate nucleotidase CysQ [Balneolaceae bacterium]